MKSELIKMLSKYFTKINYLFSVVPKWEFSHIALPVKNLFELRVHFAELLRNEMTLIDWSVTCERIMTSKHAPLCQQILKKGII